MDTAAFLRRIGVAEHPEPSIEGLSELHAAFVSTIPYETVQYQFGRGGPMDPETVAQRIIAREAGGYCFFGWSRTCTQWVHAGRECFAFSRVAGDSRGSPDSG